MDFPVQDGNLFLAGENCRRHKQSFRFSRENYHTQHIPRGILMRKNQQAMTFQSSIDTNPLNRFQ